MHTKQNNVGYTNFFYSFGTCLAGKWFYLITLFYVQPAHAILTLIPKLHYFQPSFCGSYRFLTSTFVTSLSSYNPRTFFNLFRLTKNLTSLWEVLNFACSLLDWLKQKNNTSLSQWHGEKQTFLACAIIRCKCFQLPLEEEKVQTVLFVQMFCQRSQPNNQFTV